MARVPDQAIRRRRELTAGAWHVYELYCLHRNTATGRCNPSNQTLAAEMRCSYTHISDCKTDLVKKGWIERHGRQGVVLLVGEFAPLKVRDLAPRSSEYSELGATPPITPYKDLTRCIEPVAAAAAATAARDFRKEPIDEAFIDAIVDAKLYPRNQVEFVKNKFSFRCAQEGVEPTKGRLLYWLSIEREEVQPFLPTIGVAKVVEGKFENIRRDAAADLLLKPDPACSICHGEVGPDSLPCECQICPHCFATGMEVIEGEGTRACRHTQGETREAKAQAGNS